MVHSRSRSPSNSPSRSQSPPPSPTQPQAYVNRNDSFDSLQGTEENAALLKKEEKTISHQSLLICFDDQDGVSDSHDTIV